MKLQWKIFKLRNFYYFKLNQYNHIFAINIDSPKEYSCNIKGKTFIFNVITNQRTLLKTLVPFLQYRSALHELATRIVNN